MNLRRFDAVQDCPAVIQLWETALGERYPIHPATLLQRLGGNQNYRHGDGVVATVGPTIVGFGLGELVRLPGSQVEPTGFIAALLVSPENRRQGIGKAILGALEAHLRAEGCARVAAGRGPARFWTGIPQDLTEATACFRQAGYAEGGHVCDLVVPLRQYAATRRYQEKLQEAGAEVVSATTAMLPELLAFEYREFPGWAPAILRLAANGDLANVLVVRAASGIIGSILTYAHDTGWRYPNQVWDRLIGGRLGGYGAVGIAKDRRGEGLGAAMCEAAAAYLEAKGADAAFIDWTGIPDFYRRVGAEVWRWHWLAEKAL